MRIGILVSSIGNFGKKGFYNTQEIGLAKALDHYFDEVRVYKFVSLEQEASIEKIEGCQNTSLQYIPAKSIGVNGVLDTEILDETMDVLVYFSDTQFAVPKVWKWTKKNNVQFYPYIGVLDSHSTSALKKLIVDSLAKRNYRVYRKSTCLAKTPDVEKKLRTLGADHIHVAPVGLDLSILKSDFRQIDVVKLKEKYGYRVQDKVLLFVGRFTEEKQPVKMIEIFNEVLKQNDGYRLIIVGSGELKESVLAKIEELKLGEKVKIIERIPNKDIWELYRISEAFVNLNQQEIFGMAILEAMYYGCKVVAWKAPGPEFIIENDINGCIRTDENGIVDAILNVTVLGEVCNKRVMEYFTWDTTARKIKSLAIKGKGKENE